MTWNYTLFPRKLRGLFELMTIFYIIHGESDNVVTKLAIDEFIKKMNETENIYELHSFENTGHIDINNMTDFMMNLADSFLVMENIIEVKQEL